MLNEDQIKKLKDRDYYLILDKSGSMDERDTPTKQSRWDYAKETTLQMALKLGEFDPDGITVVPFAGSHAWYPNTTRDTVEKIFSEQQPGGSTILTPALKRCFDDYASNKTQNKAKANGAIVVVITDGCPSDEGDVAKSIVNFGNSLKDGREEFGIAFLQVGKDPHAAAFLKRLDDNLTREGAKYDIVDTKTMEELETIGLTDAVFQSLTD